MNNSIDKIDVVYTWVNGRDPIWQKKQQHYFNESIQTAMYEPDQIDDQRYVENDELRYSIRSIVKFADWINKIYIVTDDQRPTWLIENERIVIVDHKDIIPVEYLPTFNSSVIESHLHNIKELSEKFIYFNDDTFLGRPCKPKHFFKNEIPRVFTSSIFPSVKEKNKKQISYNTLSIRMSRDLVERTTGKKVNYGFKHGIRPMLKSRLKYISEIYSPHLSMYYSEKFRLNSFSLIYCYAFHEIYSNRAKSTYQKNIKRKYSFLFNSGFFYVSDKNISEFSKNFQYLKPLVFCINEVSLPLSKINLFSDGELSSKTDYEK